MMSLPDDYKKAIEEAMDAIERRKEIPTVLPIGVIYDVGLTIIFLLAEKESKGEDTYFERQLFLKLEDLLPEELTENGPELFSGDLEEEVQVGLSFDEVDLIGYEALRLPTGREVIEVLPLIPEERGTFDALKNRHILSALAVEEAFVGAGGRRNVRLR